jgi:hypothetical protein
VSGLGQDSWRRLPVFATFYVVNIAAF